LFAGSVSSKEHQAELDAKWKGGVLMQRRAVSHVSLPLQFAFLFLAFSVFSWGLQARLSQYKTNGRTSDLVVKMSTDKRSSLKSLPSSSAEEPLPDFEKLANRLIFAVYQSSAASPNEIEQVELSLVS
jgi:hypothetical protein